MFRNLLRPAAVRRFATATATIELQGLRYKDGTYPFRWLRDSCQCPECIHPTTRQKLHRTTDIAADIRPSPGSVEHLEDGVNLTWDNGHKSFYPNKFLSTYSSHLKRHEFHQDVEPESWDNQRLISRAAHLFVTYKSLEQPSELLAAISQLIRFGLLFITGVPTQETSNDKCEARILARKFGEIRDTFYGDLWDVINVRNSTNVAYTNLFLGLHMDLMYFQHPPRYQQLHCLRNRVQGGKSFFVDALHAANRLRTSYSSDFDILTTTPMPFHYLNAGNHLHQSHPTIELDALPSEESSSRRIKYINYSPPFQAPLPPSMPDTFYTALERFVGYIEDPGAKFEYTLKEGDAVIFDNRRVLHARTAFKDVENNGEGPKVGETNRWLKGCYFEADTLLSRGRVLRKGE